MVTTIYVVVLTDFAAYDASGVSLEVAFVEEAQANAYARQKNDEARGRGVDADDRPMDGRLWTVEPVHLTN